VARNLRMCSPPAIEQRDYRAAIDPRNRADMTPAAFALLALTALFVLTQIVRTVFDVTDSENPFRPIDNEIPSGIA
jgi:hypothetical protein